MWLVSAFFQLSSTASASGFSTSRFLLSQTLVPRTLAPGCGRRLARPPVAGVGLFAADFTAKSGRGFSDDGGAGVVSGAMIPEDVISLLRTVYTAKPTPQFCLTTTGSGGQAVSWLLGVPGASACLLEAAVPYSMAACDEKLAAVHTSGYCSREAAETLAQDAYSRAIALCVAASSRGPHALAETTVIGVGCTAAVASTRPKRGSHRCFVCARTKDGVTHYRLELVKGRRDRAGEDAAVSRVVLQALAEAVDVTVPIDFKTQHLFLSTAHDPAEGDRLKTGKNASSAAGGVRGQVRGDDATAKGKEESEAVPTGEVVVEADAIEELVGGRLNAVLIVPRDTRPRRDSRKAAAASGSDVSEDGVGEGDGDASAVETVVALRNGEASAALPRDGAGGATVILPGSYNPLHRGHLGLMEAARALQAEVLMRSRSEKRAAREDEEEDGAATVHAVFEISVSNPDKGVLAADEVRRRTGQFSDRNSIGWPHPVMVTRAPLFSEKAKLFPGCTFVVGADTAKRIVDPKYYGNSLAEMVAALAQILHLGCSFIVGGRAEADGHFLTLEDVLKESGLPDSLRGMFHGLDEGAFREDLSSTSIRAGSTKEADAVAAAKAARIAATRHGKLINSQQTMGTDMLNNNALHRR